MKSPAPPVGTGRRRLRRTAMLLLALGALAAGGAFWLRQARITQMRAALPAVPAATPNATLRTLLEQALAQAATDGRATSVAEFGRLLHANGFAAEAEACWRILLRLQPDEARWHHYLADLRRTAGDYAAAEAHWQAAVAADPTAATAWLQLAELKFKTGRRPEAESDYRRRLSLLPGDPYAELGLARVAQFQGRIAETLERLERVLKNHPRFSAAHNLYAELQAAAGRVELADHHRWLGREAGRFREADDPWMDELNTRCHEPKRLCHLGTIAYQTGRGDLGRAQFERAIALAPDDPLAYQLLGELLLEQKQPEAARDLLARGIALARVVLPTPAHYLNLGEACRSLDRSEHAHQALRDGLVRHPDAAELHAGLGHLLAAQGRNPEALTAHRRALALNPALGESDFAVALMLLELGRREEAVQALQHALEMQPTFPKALLLLGRLEMDAGRLEQAGLYLHPLLKVNPGVPEIRRITARWHLQAGLKAMQRNDAEGSLVHFREGVRLHPDDPGLNSNLGVQLLVVGRPDEAVIPLETYHRLEPQDPQSALFLGQAYAQTGRLADARRLVSTALRLAEQAGNTATAAHCREILGMLPP